MEQVPRINHCCHLMEAGIADGDGGISDKIWLQLFRRTGGGAR